MPDRWLRFDELQEELRITNRQLRRLVRLGKVTGLCFGNIHRLETDWRYLDPSDKYRQALSVQERILSNQYDFDIGEFPLLSTAEVAEILQVTPNRVRCMIWRDNLAAAAKIGKNNLFTPNQVRDILLKRQKKTAHTKPSMEALLRWVMAYVKREGDRAVTLEKMKHDDMLEGMLKKLLKLKEPHRSREIKALWRRLEISKDVAEVVRKG